MNSRYKAIAVASISSAVVGIVLTLYLWSRIGFDMKQVTPVLTMILLCFLLAGVQTLRQFPIYYSYGLNEFLTDPWPCLLLILGAELMWFFHYFGVDYSAFCEWVGLGISPADIYVPIGAVAGFLAAEVYLIVRLRMHH